MAKTKPKTAPMADAAIDRHMMLNPCQWPCWPLLPVKRRPKDGTGVQCAVIVAVEGHLTTVFDAHMIELGGTNLKESLFENEQVVKYVYTDVDAIQADGWVVD